jgi:hypothetical protein
MKLDRSTHQGGIRTLYAVAVEDLQGIEKAPFERGDCWSIPALSLQGYTLLSGPEFPALLTVEISLISLFRVW